MMSNYRSNQNTSNQNTSNKTVGYKNNDKFDTVDYKYICIKKDLFDVNMIDIKYNNIKQTNYIEILYKSPALILDGLFFQTPPIFRRSISIFHKDKNANNANNATIKINLNQLNNPQFIQILKSIDEYISAYINRIAPDIDLAISNDKHNTIHNNKYMNYIDNVENCSVAMLRYDQIIKFNAPHKPKKYTLNGNNISSANSNAISNSSIAEIPKHESYDMYLKSYLDKNIINELELNIASHQYVFTFNISSIYIGNNSISPFIKCNRCELVGT